MNEQKRDHGKAEAILIAIAGANQARPKTEKEKELADREKLLRAWRKWHREQLEQALDGLHGDVMRGLMAQLKDLRSARALVDFISACDWSRIDANTRMVALHEINEAITKVRERMNPKEPINDALPGQPLTAFQMIREIITKVSPPLREKATPGAVPG
jgi:hypothetical protein